jgi:hypothetical protein
MVELLQTLWFCVAAADVKVIVELSFTTTAKVLAALVPQELSAVTLIFPFSPAPPVVTVTVFVPAPLVMVHPAGKVQL